VTKCALIRLDAVALFEREPSFEQMRKFIGDRTGLLFPSKKGTTPVSYTNLL
jgi:hypothetical protein